MAISEASQLCVRFIFRNRMHRFWFRMFMFKERSLWCLRELYEEGQGYVCSSSLHDARLKVGVIVSDMMLCCCRVRTEKSLKVVYSCVWVGWVL
ncbi:hypothetical protein Ahy_B02g059259 isoform H [Arachis hypogaea]|uniref:Uncharacterized protein n=1 Tax=Arachis hypogaea TaxID=3818 RepID=A0A445AGD8_ARAHY|nr:hypothetical protein Ahy_B02g059259 isoform H [Arachis hypogaea]